MNTLRLRSWRLATDRRGFTLIETVIGLAILSVVVSAAGATVVQAVRTDKSVVSEGLAANELRKGFAWFVEDAKMARNTSLVDQGSPEASVAFSWTDEWQGAGVAHAASYGLEGSGLVRSHDGTAHVIAHRVKSVAFSRQGRVITARITVDAGRGDERTLSIRGVMRPR